MHEESVLTTVILIVGLLLTAAAAGVGLKRAHLPYSVGLVIVGIVLGALRDRVDFLETLRGFELSPDLILFVFLPTLIFESAFNLDVRMLSKNLPAVLTLAAPGLLLSTAITGVVVASFTPLGMGPALVFGALISATDPVAVIALFKELGAPKRLAILVEGESLFNDATAIVLFGILVAVVAAGGFSGAVVGRGVLDFLRVFAGGLLVGTVIGYLMVRSIALAEDEPLVEVALSTVVAYAAFIAAEHYLHVSGVMATVGAGVVIGFYGTTRFTPELKAYLRQFWEYAAYVANSLIFLLVGLSIDLGALAGFAGPIGVAIVAVLAARAVTVFGIVPVVGRLPNAERISGPFQVIMFWGGLRGAVALALALSLPATFAEKELIVALAVGIVLFTLVSGGLTMKPLIDKLGLSRPGVVDRMAATQATLAAKREALSRLEALSTAGHFSGRIVEDLTAKYERERDEANSSLYQLCTGPEIARETMVHVLLTQALTVERRVYRDLFDRGLVSEAVLHELDLGVELERDALKRGAIFDALPEAVPLEVRLSSWMNHLWARIAPRSGAVQRHRLRALAANYERDAAVLAASEKVEETLSELGELSGVDPDVVETCRQIYEDRADKAMDRIDSIAEHFPEYASAVQERTAQRIALDAEADAVQRLAEAGGIPETVARDARRMVEDAQRDLARRPVSAKLPGPEELLLRVPFFQDLAREDFQRVASNLVPRTVLPGNDVIKQGERGDSLFLIARGVVAVMVSTDGPASARRVASLYAGDFFGEMALLSDEPRTATVQAVTACQLYELARKDVEALCEVCTGVRDALAEAFRQRRESLQQQGDG